MAGNTTPSPPRWSAAGGSTLLGGEALQPTPTATYLRGTRTDDVHPWTTRRPSSRRSSAATTWSRRADDDAALEVAKLCPARYGYIELRPIWEFGG